MQLFDPCGINIEVISNMIYSTWRRIITVGHWEKSWQRSFLHQSCHVCMFWTKVQSKSANYTLSLVQAVQSLVCSVVVPWACPRECVVFAVITFDNGKNIVTSSPIHPLTHSLCYPLTRPPLPAACPMKRAEVTIPSISAPSNSLILSVTETSCCRLVAGTYIWLY
jgi:hypothetical protein